MKVIKQLKRETPEERLRKFFGEISILTKGILATYSVLGLLILAFSNMQEYSWMSLFSMRFGEIILFLLIGVSDLKREQGKGSFYLILSFLIKNLTLLGLQALIAMWVPNWPSFSYCSRTAIVLQYLFLIMVEDAFRVPENVKYLFIEPFQLKARFYPIFVFLFLTVSGIRVDLLIPFFLGIICHFSKLEKVISWISEKLDGKFCSEKLINLGLQKTGSEQRTSKPLDQLATNDSIILQEK